MYLRFVVADSHDQDAQCEHGPFRIYSDVADDLETPAHISEELHELRRWFNIHLEEPTRLTESRHPRARDKAICWFKPEAQECLTRMWEMKHLLAEVGIQVDVLKAENPGIVVYEDDQQIAVIPHWRARVQRI